MVIKTILARIYGSYLFVSVGTGVKLPLHAEIPIIPPQDCDDRYRRLPADHFAKAAVSIQDSVLCAATAQGGKDSCWVSPGFPQMRIQKFYQEKSNTFIISILIVHASFSISGRLRWATRVSPGWPLDASRNCVDWFKLWWRQLSGNLQQGFLLHRLDHQNYSRVLGQQHSSNMAGRPSESHAMINEQET